MNSRASKGPKEIYTGGHVFQSRTPHMCPTHVLSRARPSSVSLCCPIPIGPRWSSLLLPSQRHWPPLTPKPILYVAILKRDLGHRSSCSRPCNACPSLREKPLLIFSPPLS